MHRDAGFGTVRSSVWRGLAPRLLVAVGLMSVLLWQADWQEMVELLATLDPLAFGAVVLISLVLNGVSCFKWRLFLDARRHPVPLLKLNQLYLIGFFFNNFAPGSVGGDAARGYLLGRHIDSNSNSFGTMFLERFTGVVALIAIAIVAAATRPELVLNGLLLSMLIVLAGILGVTVLLLSSLGLQRRMLSLMGALHWKNLGLRFNRFLEVVFYFRTHPRLLTAALLLSLLFHAGSLAIMLVAFHALGLEADLMTLAVVVPMISLIAAIPVSINAIGIMEGAYVVFLAFLGFSPAEALAVALVMRARNVALTLLGGLLFLHWAEIRRRGSLLRTSPVEGAGPRPKPVPEEHSASS